MTRHPLDLSKRQLRYLLAGAALLPVRWRERYLQSVADQLLQPCSSEPISDDQVRHAVMCVLQRFTPASMPEQPGDAA